MLLDSDEPGLDRPYVSDFGLAREIGSNSRPEVLEATARYTVVGTVPYMSPEQASGQRATTLSDVYGLGAILYELLTGEAPFSGDDERDQLSLVRDLARMPQPPRHIHPRVDRTLEAICLKCLAKDSEQRYRSAEGLAKDLDRWLQHWPTEARPRRALGRTLLWARRSPVGVALVLALAGLTALLGINLADRLQEPRRTHTILADQRAGEFGLRLQQLGLAVASTAAEPMFPELLRAQNFAALQSFVAEVGDRSNDPNRLSPFESWFVIDNRDGQIKARWPAMSAETEGVDFRGRDYFEGLTTRGATAGVHVSQVFRGLSDGLYKFGISAWRRRHGLACAT